MDISLFLQVAALFLHPGLYPRRLRVKICPGCLQVVCNFIEFQSDLHAGTILEIFAGIPRFQPEQFRMIIADSLKHCLQLLYIHHGHRDKGRDTGHGIGVDLSVDLLHVLLQHGIVRIQFPVKGKSFPGLARGQDTAQAVCLFLGNLLVLLLHRLVPGQAAQLC